MYMGLRRTLRHFRRELGLPPIRAAEGAQQSGCISWGLLGLSSLG